MIRFMLALLLLALALVLQFWLASFGIFLNLAVASLIAFAFLFDLWDLVVFILATIFVINWQPVFSIEIGLVAALPLAAYALKRYSTSQAWAAVPACVAIALVVLYGSIAPGLFLSAWKIFLTDLAACVIGSGVVFAALDRRVNQ